MAFDKNLVDRLRELLVENTNEDIVEKPMFGGIAFLVNGKMCINVSGNRLMCRFDPKRSGQLNEREGVEPMIMREKVLDGYCYVNPEGYKSKNDFEFWINICLDFNSQAQASIKQPKKKN